MRPFLAALAVSLSLAACGSDQPSGQPGTGGKAPQEPAPQAQLYEVSATVLEDRTHGPMLCLGVILASLPPQCGGIPLPNWHWREVDGEERRSGTIWGAYHVVGRYDGARFTVTKVEPFDEAFRPSEGSYPEPTSPCPEPAGGWVGVDDATQNEAGRVHDYARSQPEYVTSWVTHLEPEKLEFSPVLVNVVFAESADLHEAELRTRWDGPLCVVERDVPTARELSRVRRDVEAGLDQLGLEMLWSSGPDLEPVIQIGVVADPDRKGQAKLDARYGPGLVRLYPALRPVS